MSIFEILLIGIGLSMDAFAVAICKGLSIKNIDFKKVTCIALYFGIFQALMPFLGYYLGTTFSKVVVDIDHWIAFILLSVIGGKMIKDSFQQNSEDKNDKIDVKTMTILAIATSIDALAIGVTFAFFEISIFTAIIIIGIITFTLSAFGVIIGNKFGDEFEGKAEIIGGCILILIGVKILLEHLGVL